MSRRLDGIVRWVATGFLVMSVTLVGAHPRLVDDRAGRDGPPGIQGPWSGHVELDPHPEAPSYRAFFAPELVRRSTGILVHRGQLRLLRERGQVELEPVRFERPIAHLILGMRSSGEGREDIRIRSRVSGDHPWSDYRTLPDTGEASFDPPAAEVQIELTIVRVPSGWDPYVVDGMTLTPDELVMAPAPPVRLPGNPLGLERPAVVSREAWGAQAPRRAYVSHQPRILVVHHTAVPTIAQYRGEATIRGIQNYHRNTRGWNDIGYHYLIGPDGKIFAGVPERSVGTHAIPNTGKIGVCVIGNYEDGDDFHAPDNLCRSKLVPLLAYLCDRHRLSVEAIKGHQDYQPKACPGRQVYQDLGAIRDEVDDLIQ